MLCRVRSGQTQSFAIESEEAVVGRDANLAVPLPLEDVSRRHARIFFDGKQHWIEDLGSTNGTFLNGRRLGKEAERLRHLSVVGVGKASELVFLVSSEETQPLRRTGIVHAFLIRTVPDALPYEVAVGDFTVGRSPACNIVSESAEVSKIHARLTRSADRLIVRDLGSANGTWVNGARVAEAPLADGDLVGFGVEQYRVSIALGEVAAQTLTGLEAAAPAPAAAESVPPPSRWSDWKLRAMGPLEPGLAEAPEAAGDATERGGVPRPSGLSEPIAAPRAAQPAPAEAVELRLSAPGIELVAPGRGSHLVGSGDTAVLRLAHASVADAHARLIVSDMLGSVFVQREAGDTFLNGQPVEKPEPLADGDLLRLGEVELRVVLRRR